MEPKIHKTDNKKYNLEEMQHLVGGYIQVIELHKIKSQMIINEEGKLIGLPKNDNATKMFHEEYPHLSEYDYICGDAIILSGKARLT